MKQKILNPKRFLAAFMITGFLCALPVTQIRAETFFGEAKVGSFQIEGYHDPVFLYVPEHYEAKKIYPLIIALPAAGQTAEKYIEEWKSFGKWSSVIILVPTCGKNDRDVPYKVDEWLLKIKSDVMKRYSIAETRVYLVGQDDNAHYAAYLGTKYPREFSGVALLDGGWVGPFSQLIRPESAASKQVPFFISIKGKKMEILEQNMNEAYRFEKKGYLVTFEKAEETEDFSSREFKKRLWDWFENKAQVWVVRSQARTKSKKEQLKIWLENNIKVESR